MKLHPNNINHELTTPVDVRRDEGGTIHFEDKAQVQTGPHPFYSKNKKRHNLYDQYGRWIGDDLAFDEEPYRTVSDGIILLLSGIVISDIFRRYSLQDYGSGEAGFASYQIPCDTSIEPCCVNADTPKGHIVWLIDDAVRTPEGEPPAREPTHSPGPQHLLLPHEY